LEKSGVKRIETVGKQFDPHRHEAVGVKDSGKDNEVLEEMQAGYMLGETVLRHAKVIVSKGN
jgi:molecular chaperone GrpE